VAEDVDVDGDDDANVDGSANDAVEGVSSGSDDIGDE
jgi:hypothetical protein